MTDFRLVYGGWCWRLLPWRRHRNAGQWSVYDDGQSDGWRPSANLRRAIQAAAVLYRRHIPTSKSIQSEDPLRHHGDGPRASASSYSRRVISTYVCHCGTAKVQMQH